MYIQRYLRVHGTNVRVTILENVPGIMHNYRPGVEYESNRYWVGRNMNNVGFDCVWENIINPSHELAYGGFPTLAPYNRANVHPQILCLTTNLQVRLSRNVLL